MKTIKLAILAVTVAGASLAATAADARPHQRHKVCQTKWEHHHKVTRCFWR